MLNTKIILFGSAAFTIKVFLKIINNFKVVAIVTQPDKRSGRGLKYQETPISKFAKKHNIPLLKPENINDIYKELLLFKPDILLTFAYGQILSNKILNLAKIINLNIHGSLLPKYRGAAPIQYAILNNEKEIGISLIKMNFLMDAGEIIFQDKDQINEKTNTLMAINIIISLIEKNIVSWLEKIINGNYQIIIQNPKQVSYAPKIQKKDCELLLSFSKFEATRKIRAFNPYPGAFIFLNGKRLKIFEVSNQEFNQAIKLSFKDGILYAIDYQWATKKRIICK